jgi:glycine hydroxymethyltransferase
MCEIAKSVGATLLVDMAHFAGLVAGKVMKGDFNPIPFADIVTSTTHKTLRGPRGGLVLCRKEFKEVVDKGCPLVLGGPLPHVLAAKAVAFREASSPHFEAYAHQIVANCRVLAEELIKRGVRVTTGGTDNHLLLFDTAASFGLTGRQAESALREARFTVNRNAIPFDVNGPWYTSGIRMGTPAVTSLGMKEAEMGEIAALIAELLFATKPAPAESGKAPSRAQMLIDPLVLKQVQARVEELLSRFPLYPELPLV